jgi:hypothetical protein
MSSKEPNWTPIGDVDYEKTAEKKAKKDRNERWPCTVEIGGRSGQQRGEEGR